MIGKYKPIGKYSGIGKYKPQIVSRSYRLSIKSRFTMIDRRYYTQDRIKSNPLPLASSPIVTTAAVNPLVTLLPIGSEPIVTTTLLP
jgi:hypothetical protein